MGVAVVVADPVSTPGATQRVTPLAGGRPSPRANQVVAVAVVVAVVAVAVATILNKRLLDIQLLLRF